MKNVLKALILICLSVFMLLSAVSCNSPFAPKETTANNETANGIQQEDPTPEEQYKLEMQTVFEMAKSAGYTGTLEDLIAMFKGEAGPAGTDGVTPHIGQNGNWWVGNTDLGVLARGPQGEPGRGVLKMEMINGELIVFYTDGSSQNLGPVLGGNTSTPETLELVYIIKVTDANNQPIQGVELVLFHGDTRIYLPATLSNGYTYSELIEKKDYTIRVAYADGYRFDSSYEYSFIQNSNVAYITLSPAPVTPPSTDDTEDDLDMPEKVNLGGYTYKAYVRSNAVITGGNTLEDGNPSFYCEDFWVDPNKGEPEDVLEYAVYLRNKEIENDYNVKIRQINQTGNMTSELLLFFQNGDKYDLTIIHAKSAAAAATQNLLRDLNDLSGLNLEHEAYDQNSIRELSIGGKLYFLSGDMNISTLDSVSPTVVNMEMYENYADGIVEAFEGDPLYSDIYALVTAGEWTMANMLKIAEVASVDADPSDGDLGASEADEIGYFQYDQSAVYYFYGAGGRITQIDDEGSPEFVIQNQKNHELFNYLFDSLHPVNRTTAKYPHGFSSARKTHFINNGTTLFTDMTLWDVRKDLYANASFTYGLLPTPVYETGDDYHSVVYFYNTVHLWAIPSMSSNLERAQIMMNAMAAYSNLKKEGSTMDGYYTRTLCFSIAPDPNARRVMNIIKSSTVYDIALLYDWGGWATEFSQLWFKKTTNNYGSLVAQMPLSGGALNQLEETIERFKNP